MLCRVLHHIALCHILKIVVAVVAFFFFLRGWVLSEMNVRNKTRLSICRISSGRTFVLNCDHVGQFEAEDFIGMYRVH